MVPPVVDKDSTVFLDEYRPDASGGGRGCHLGVVRHDESVNIYIYIDVESLIHLLTVFVYSYILKEKKRKKKVKKEESMQGGWDTRHAPLKDPL